MEMGAEDLKSQGKAEDSGILVLSMSYPSGADMIRCGSCVSRARIVRMWGLMHCIYLRLLIV